MKNIVTKYSDSSCNQVMEVVDAEWEFDGATETARLNIVETRVAVCCFSLPYANAREAMALCVWNDGIQF